jgi:hypothetical protein
MTSLRQCMIEDMQVRNLTKCTQDSCVRQVSLFARHFKKPWCVAIDGTAARHDRDRSVPHHSSGRSS